MRQAFTVFYDKYMASLEICTLRHCGTKVFFCSLTNQVMWFPKPCSSRSPACTCVTLGALGGQIANDCMHIATKCLAFSLIEFRASALLVSFEGNDVVEAF